MSDDDVTDEWLIPELMGSEVDGADHQVRYQAAMPHVAGRRVLDAGCGSGWGAALLAKAGAKNVVGLDVDQGAVIDAKRRVPSVEFLVGDLLDLPFGDDNFDVVVCFEAIEHTGDTARTLDELTRVLRGDGLLLVSSPNPNVYEETPEALLSQVQARFSNTRLMRQHTLIASLLLEDGSMGSEQPFTAALCSVVPLGPGHDSYSLAFASHVALPDMTPLAMLAPSDQLEEFERFNAQLEKERMRLIAELDGAAARLAEVEARRDSFAAMVLAAEQELAAATQQHTAEIEALVNSISWKATAPLRRVGSGLRRHA